jgi:hypothetical protein
MNKKKGDHTDSLLQCPPGLPDKPEKLLYKQRTPPTENVDPST